MFSHPPRLLPGPPYELHVLPEKDELIEIENGQPVDFEVEVRDIAGNPTPENKKHAICTVSEFCREGGTGNLSK